jgi:cyanobactin maturation PatA/PatG family protease
MNESTMGGGEQRAWVVPSGCWECGEGKPPPIVYVLGQLSYDFGSEARRDSFLQRGIANPEDPAQLLAHLDRYPALAAALTWTLSQDATPIYALQPGGAFAGETHARLREVLTSQLVMRVERVSIPGWMQGEARLRSGQTVPIIWPEARGIRSWSTAALVDAVLGKAQGSERDLDRHGAKAAEIANFLERVYFELRNLGQAPWERAINFAATTAFQLDRVYESAIKAGLNLDKIAAEQSPLCRRERDCWDVKLTFFQPAKRLERAREVYRFTVDVSEALPVTLGKVRHWSVY